MVERLCFCFDEMLIDGVFVDVMGSSERKGERNKERDVVRKRQEE